VVVPPGSTVTGCVGSISSSTGSGAALLRSAAAGGSSGVSITGAPITLLTINTR
jgi:hypothetical protein